MSRDMTLFVDDDGKGYHIYSSEDNLTLHIAELTEGPAGVSLTAAAQRAGPYPCPFSSRWNHITYFPVFSL